jgi:UDP-N-acetylglucosamine:LPS N-acetylglucosamine transferase
MKICLVASAGGHLSQLLRTAESWQHYDVCCVTTTETVTEKLRRYGKAYSVGECNRRQPIRVLAALVRCVYLVLRERPDVIISTGAAAGCMCCFVGKHIGAKIVWIDSITNVRKLSLSGWLVRRISNVFLVQWPELTRKYKGVEYVGELI